MMEELKPWWFPISLLVSGFILISGGLTHFITKEKIGNIYEKQIEKLEVQRELLIDKADSLQEKLITIDERIEDKEEALNELRETKDEVLDSINDLTDDEIFRFLSDRYNINPRISNDN